MNVSHCEFHGFRYEKAASIDPTLEGKISEAWYRTAEAYLVTGAYEDAVDAFTKAGEYSDAAKRINESYYKKGEALFVSGDYTGAIAAFKMAGSYENTAEMICECHYCFAKELYSEGNYLEAYLEFNAALDYKDAKAFITEDENLLSVAREAKQKAFKTTGSHVFFGAYEQDNIKENGAEAIEWIVLDVKDNKAMLISLYGLDNTPYNKNNSVVAWRDCSCRKWLNKDFLASAFTNEEKGAIITTTVKNDVDKDTEDSVYLLSTGEVGEYFADNESRLCKATDYAQQKGAVIDSENSSAVWMLRTLDNAKTKVYYVNAKGDIFSSGLITNTRVIRPVIWIDLDSDFF